MVRRVPQECEDAMRGFGGMGASGNVHLDAYMHSDSIEIGGVAAMQRFKVHLDRATVRVNFERDYFTPCATPVSCDHLFVHAG